MGATVSSSQSTTPEGKRLAALRRYAILDTLPEIAFDELARMAMQISGAALAVISFVDEERAWFKSHLNWEPSEVPRSQSFCDVAIQKDTVLEVPDTALDPRFRGLRMVLDAPHVRAYYGAPIITMDGQAIGVLGVKFLEPTRLAPVILDTLRIVARQVMTQLELRRHLVQLSKIFEDHRRAEEALRTTEAFFQALVESLPQRIVRKDTEGRFTFASRNFCAELKRPLEAIRGRTDFDFFPAELARKYHEDDARVMGTREPFEAVEEHLRSDGSKGFVQVVKTPLVDPRGNVVGVQGIFWDVTQQRQTEQALAHERDLLRALLDHIPDRIFFKDAQSRFIRCSASMFSSLGFNHPDEVINKTDFDYYGEKEAAQYFEEEQKIIETGQPLINKLQHHGGAELEETWSSVTKVPIYNNRGVISGIVGLSRDITKLMQAEQALRQAEEKYRNIVENSVEGIFQTSPDGRYLSANRALARLYGYESASELVEAMTDIQHQLYVDPNRREEFSKLMREKGEVTGFESQIRRRNGQVIWISESARSVCDSRGNLLYYEGSVEDITVRKSAQEAREAASKEALESARVKAQFLANMSHEFRTPLNAIIGNASVLLAGRLNPDQRELLEPICDSAEALNRLINDILDFSKIEAGKLTLERIDFDVRDIVEGTAEMLAHAARVQGNELLCRIENHVPQVLRGDPVRVRQVLMNLLSNAIKFTKRGDVTVHLRALDNAGQKPRLRFDVVDTGIGIPDKAKSIIFQSFTQADGSTTRKFGGTGLGLTISKQIVELMGGAIGFESEVGKGSTFWFEVELEPALAPAPGRPGQIDLSGRRALICDDHQATCETLVHYMASLGVEAVGAGGVEEVQRRLLEATESGQFFDWVFIETDIPAADLKVLLQTFRSSPPLERAKRIAMAPLGCRPDPATLRAQEIAACLVKPVKVGRLTEVLQASLLSEALLDEEPASEAAETSLALPSLPGGTRILLAEDNPVNQQVALRMLRSLGLKADVAGNGYEVLAALQRESYDLVLLDCQMPEMDGYETARRIGEMLRLPEPALKSKPILVAVTANAMTGDREKCLAAGMDDYLSKPMKLSSLAQVLERILIGNPQAAIPVSESRSETPAEEAPGDMDLSVIRGLRELREPGQPDPLGQLVQMFLRDGVPRVASIEDALMQGDAARCAAAAHSLKGSASNFGARRLAALASTLEKHSKAGDVTAARTVLSPLKEEFQKVKLFLEAEVER